MQTESEIIESLFDKSVTFTKNDLIKAMRAFGNQFRWVKTTCGKNIEFDDLDYEVLRQQDLFFANDRKCVMAVWKSKNGKNTVAPIAKLLLDAEGKSVIHYEDKNPLNLKRNNLKLITHQVAQYKQVKRKKQKTSNGGNEPTSIYKGVSWSRFAKKWSAYIKLDYKKKHLGYFTQEEMAAAAYNKAAIEAWGENHTELNILPQ